jgi:ElaB/YqjD/DUF883 family membrane-anchored ribosome-binding protein
VTLPPDESAEQSRSPEEIRKEIEQTREQVGDTVEALAEKSDVKAQARQRISAVKDTAQRKRDEYVSKAKQSTPDSASAGAQQVAATVRQKPVPFTAAGAFAAGLLVGRMLGR